MNFHKNPPNKHNYTKLGNETEFDIRIAENGVWYHEGKEIRRPNLVKLFASVLTVDGSGVYWLQTPVERGRILVDDAPFVVIRMEVSRVEPKKCKKICFYTNVDDQVVLSQARPLRLLQRCKKDGLRPYIEVRSGLLAKLSRPVYYELAKLAEMGPCKKFGIWSQNQFFPLER